MSRGFVREEDQEELPFVPPRAYLPPGATNFVTPNGLDELLAEKATLQAEKEAINMVNENEKRIAINYINAKLSLLEARLASAKIIDLEKENPDRIQFGATILLKMDDEEPINFQIVGVDEADLSKNKISFLSPLAKSVMNKKAGEKTSLKLPKGERMITILNIYYMLD